MDLPKFTSYMIKNQPDQTAYLLNKMQGHGGGDGGKLYNTTGSNTDGAMTQKATTDALGTKANAVDVGNALAGKVDKVAGKGLSTNDFTDADESKLDGIEAGAQVNVQADWTQSDTTADDYIKNKPNIPVVPTQVHIALDMSNETYTSDYTWAQLKGFVNNNNEFLFELPGNGDETYNFVSTSAVAIEIDNDEYIILSASTYYYDSAEDNLPYLTIGIILSTNGSFSIASDTVVGASEFDKYFYDYFPSNLVYHNTPSTVVNPTPYVSFADLIWSGIFDKIYPVGSTFSSTTLSTPAAVATALGGGTWVEDTDFDLVAYAYVTNQTTIANSKNITSVTGSSGTYTVNFSKDMADTNYVAFVSGEVANRGQEIIGVYDKTVSRFRYDFSNYSGSATNPSQINIAVFGRLETPEVYKYKRTA